MKTKTILFLFLLISGMMSAQVKRVAILETVDKENKVSYANKLILRANLSKAITQTSGYEAYDRTDIDAIMGEQDFQRTGLVSNDQIKKLGEMTGANYILVAEAVVVDARTMFITAKLLDVETARTIMTDNMMMGTTADAIQKGCIALAKKMFYEENTTSAVETEKKTVFKKQDQPKKAKIELVPAEIQLVRNSKTDQKLFGVQAYSYGETQMDKKAYEAFLRNNAPEVFKRYLRGKACISAGWTMFAIGAAATVAGGACMVLSYRYDKKMWECVNELERDNMMFDRYNLYNFTPSDEREQYLYDGYIFYRAKSSLLDELGIGLMSGGAGLTVISIPIMSAGHGIVNNTPRRFNKQNMVRADLSLNLQSSQNGIGLALNF